MFKLDNQHLLFSYQAMPILFHNQSSEFFRILEKDGDAFLLFWWNHVGDRFEDKDKVSSQGLGHEIRILEDGRKVALIRLPEPKNVNEAYYLAMVASPARKSFWLWKNFTNVFALERTVDANGKLGTYLSQWTPRALRSGIGEGPVPNLEAFYRQVHGIVIKPKK